MKRRLVFSFLLCLLLLPGLGDTAVSAQSGPAYEILQLVNQFRAAQGLYPFQLNSALTAAAQNQANWMAANVIFSSHVGEGGSTPQSRAEAAGYVGYVVENIVGGAGMTPQQGVTWWQNSPVHYNTQVTTRYIEAGVGYATNGVQNFYVLVVGRPSDSPPPANPTGATDESEPLIITPIELAQPGEDGSIVHVVQAGQALWTLAAYYETPLADLLLFNNLAQDAFLQPGDEVIIRLAEGQAPPPTPTPPLAHIVQSGQSLWSIAALYGIKLSDLLWYNGLDTNVVLQPGDEVIVRLAPGQSPPPTPTPITTHIVRSGQTLWDIALTYGLTLDELLAYNGIDAGHILQPGEELRVRPPATPTPSPTPSPLHPLTPSPFPTPSPRSAELTSKPHPLTPSPFPTPAPPPAPSPPYPAPAESQNVGQTVTIIVLIVGVGLAVLAGIAMLVTKQR